MKNDFYKEKRNITEKEIMNKLFRYCAYQERCINDVINQLKKHEVDPELRKVILEKLRAEGFIDEKRFSRMYVLGKLRNNHWGKIKIKQGLKGKLVDARIILEAIESIDETEYMDIIDNLIKKK
jgi:regulatory protein